MVYINCVLYFKGYKPIEPNTHQSSKKPESDTPTDSAVDLSLSDEKLPESFSISIIMESKPSKHPWADEVWDARGIVASSGDLETQNKAELDVKVIEQGEIKQLIYSGMNVRLFVDECESYYHNMMSPEPGCFIVARAQDEDGEDTDMPIPVLATLSFDEAHSYLEGDDIVYAVPIPAELYRWAEAYVLENYVAEKRKKRKRVDWKKGDKRNSSSHEPAFENKGKNDA